MSQHYTNQTLPFLSATAIARLIRNKELSSEAITKLYLERIKQHNPQLNAIVIDLSKDAIERAKAADKALAEGKALGRLHGVPITVKEAFNIKDYKTTVNFKFLKNNVAKENSDVVNQLYQEGAIILGKTNVPTMLGDHQTFGPLYPRANNPFDLSRTTGGSTGGGAAAVATGLCGFEIGSDIGGSIRVPAHFCGIYGLKTTEEAVSSKGHIPPLPNAKGTFKKMGVFGPLARSLEDLELAFDLIKKADFPKYNSSIVTKTLTDYNIAWTDAFNGIQTAKETLDLLQKLINQLSNQVGQLSQTLPDIDYAKAEVNWANIFGYLIGQDMPWLIRQFAKLQYTYGYTSRSKGKWIAEGIVGPKESVVNKFCQTRQANLDVFKQFFQKHDFIISPMGVGPAFAHCKTGSPIEVADKTIPYWDMCLPFTYIASVLGLPSLTLPLGQSKNGLPIGLQIIGAPHSEKDLLHFGKLLEPYIQGYKPPQRFA